jgi:hypothetical protein
MGRRYTEAKHSGEEHVARSRRTWRMQARGYDRGMDDLSTEPGRAGVNAAGACRLGAGAPAVCATAPGSA